MKRECIGCVHLMTEYDDDRRSWHLCDLGYDTREGADSCKSQDYKEQKQTRNEHE